MPALCCPATAWSHLPPPHTFQACFVLSSHPLAEVYPALARLLDGAAGGSPYPRCLELSPARLLPHGGGGEAHPEVKLDTIKAEIR